MGPGKIILTAILAGIYSGILDGIQQKSDLNASGSALILVLLTSLSGYLLYRTGREKSSSGN
ncbi:hypothetical protein LCM10_12815 [Rossellomorea aquimaris]|uniref:hypothetical protein n=1 Tax=Rossellomorea aquimaris TaxID=189382 RepID=UPI001CD66518|nr:hypothetical protein [Rossellomorea aquimaris]MCA1055872.1 hypothetical protein [Rossellomorea aquimaris]